MPAFSITVKVTGKNKKGKKLSKTLKCAVTVKTPKITAAPAQTVKVGATASVKPSVKPASAKLSYKSSDAAVAAVDANGVVTGVAAGKATVTVTAKVGTKTLTATTDVTVEANEVVITEVKQYSSRGFTATFTDDASKLFTKDDITVESADKTDALAVKSVEFAADGKSANVTLLKDFTDGVSYNVTAKGVTLSLTAKVGAVASIKINTASAQQSVKTKIEFQLFDKEGIDVTPATDLDAKCYVTLDGTYTDASISKASDASITMNTVGDKATVKVTYNSGAKDEQDVTATQEITCVDAKAVVGTLVFANTTKKGANGCAQFYLGLSDEKVSLKVDDSTSNLFFYAKDGNGEAVNYDEYDAEAADDDIISVSVNSGATSGKYAQLTVNGLKAGNSKIIIKATKTGKSTQYTIPVEVYEVGAPVKMTVSPVTVSNVYDSAYKEYIKPEMFDAAGHKVDAEYEYSVDGISVDSDGLIHAAEATAKTYTVQVTGTDKKTGAQMTRNTSVQVKALPDKAYTADGINLTYSIELDHKTLDQNPYDGDKNVTVKIRATYNNLFAGYVRGNGTDNITVAEKKADGKNSYVTPSDSSRLADVAVGIKQGNTRFDAGSAASLDLMTTQVTTGAYIVFTNSNNSSTITNNTQSGYTYKSVNAGTDGVIYTGDRNSTLAKTGSYTVEAALVYDTAGSSKNNIKNIGIDFNGDQVVNGSDAPKYALLTTTFTVKNSMAIPTVKIASKNVDNTDFASISKVLTTNVDLNQSDELTKSFVSINGKNSLSVASDDSLYEKPVYDKNTLKVTASTANNNKISVKYVVVTDKFNNVDWFFFVPINTTFTVK